MFFIHNVNKLLEKKKITSITTFIKAGSNKLDKEGYIHLKLKSGNYFLFKNHKILSLHYVDFYLQFLLTEVLWFVAAGGLWTNPVNINFSTAI